MNDGNKQIFLFKDELKLKELVKVFRGFEVHLSSIQNVDKTNFYLIFDSLFKAVHN